MATVRDTDLPDLLISLGYQVKRIGRYYTTQEMDSIRIKDRRTWFRYRCPAAQVVGPVVLEGYELLFRSNASGNGVATIKPKEGQQVHGL